ncbi:GNAT family N-acetyltransferase [Aureimonas pseudogalii]|uniref:Putative N-acetyltransferase YhbS n=1 Tax=Aureimonas pseudogalii TaxID=1744844 RepID=A0A7W6H4F8_9HYPH|nr:N-acetyltransferase [Aureimonas pseudogalii]MBB3998163.1 putative N-acetyltransferase YhbS [Aureimonas pseudogalii]
MLSRLQDSDLRFVAELPNHAAVIDRICAEAFGPGRFVRAAERVREAAPHDPRLSLVAVLNDEVVGSVRQTRCAIGTTPVVMLGPLAVRPAFKRRGIGRTLLAMAAEVAAEAGERAIFLVGDRAYYTPFGYRPLPVGSVRMPGPVDETRILGLELVEGSLDGVGGMVGPRH